MDIRRLMIQKEELSEQMIEVEGRMSQAISLAERNRLGYQLRLMEQYADVLEERIFACRMPVLDSLGICIKSGGTGNHRFRHFESKEDGTWIDEDTIQRLIEELTTLTDSSPLELK